MQRSRIFQLVSLVAAIILIGSGAVADISATDADADAYPQWAETTGDGVRVRAGASINHQILGVAAKGDPFVILDVTGDWAKLQAWPEIPIWISADYVTADPDGLHGTVAGSRVNLRRGPAVEGLPLGQLERGRTVKIVTKQEGFFRILPPAGVGVYMHKDYVEAKGPIASNIEAWRGEYARRLEVAAANAKKDGDTALAEGFLKHLGNARPSSGGGAAADAESDAESGAQADGADPERAARAEEHEQEILDRLSEEVRDLLATPEEERLIDEFDRLAATLYQFADAAQTPRIKGEAKQKASSLIEARAALIHARERANEPEVDAEEIARQQEAVRLQRRLHEDLWRHNTGRYTAQGLVGDQMVEGETVYLLVVNGEASFKLDLTRAYAASIRLRDFWNKQVGIRGTIVTYAGDDLPTLYVESIERLAD